MTPATALLSLTPRASIWNRTVIIGLVSDLGADVAHDASGQGQVGEGVAQGQDESVHAVVDAARDESRHEHAVGRVLAQVARPPLGGREGRRVEDEGVGVGVVGRSGLHAAHEAPVAQLGLCVGADDLVLLGERQPVGLLLVAGLGGESGREHGAVELRGQEVVDVGEEGHQLERVGEPQTPHVSHGRRSLLARPTHPLRSRQERRVPFAEGRVVLDHRLQLAAPGQLLQLGSEDDTESTERR